METFKQINWTNVNNNIYRTLSFLKNQYPRNINNFLDWYLSLDKSKITEQNLKQWVVSGIPKMKAIIQILNKEIKNVDTLLNKLLTSNMGLQEKQQKSKKYYEGIKNITETIIEFIGCRDDLNSWFLALLRNYRGLPQVVPEIGFFEDVCLESRRKLLSIR